MDAPRTTHRRGLNYFHIVLDKTMNLWYNNYRISGLSTGPQEMGKSAKTTIGVLQRTRV